jgi:hypothetical protein
MHKMHKQRDELYDVPNVNKIFLCAHQFFTSQFLQLQILKQQ